MPKNRYARAELLFCQSSFFPFSLTSPSSLLTKQTDETNPLYFYVGYAKGVDLSLYRQRKIT